MVLSALTTFLISRKATSAPVVRATLSFPPNVTLLTLGDQAGAPAISLDGTNLVFAGITERRQMLFLRPLNATTPKPLAGTDGGKFPFWSPDGKSIGFFADQQLKRLDLAGGPPLSLAPAVDGRGGTWAGSEILFAPISTTWCTACQRREASQFPSPPWTTHSIRRIAGPSFFLTENIFFTWRRIT